MQTISQILHDYLFLIPLFVLVLSDIVKIALEAMRTGVWHAAVFRSGGMPSSHSAFVTSLIMVVWRKAGLESVEFAIAFVFACIVWYDAMVARRAIGEQAQVLNRLQDWKKLTERLGHSFLEVIVGILFGLVVTTAGFWLSGYGF